MTRQGGWPGTGFGRRLREVREAKGLSQQQLADLVGLHVMSVSKLERGVQEPAWPLVVSIADALGVTCEAFRDHTGGAEEGARPRGRPKKALPAETEPAAKSKGRKPGGK
jgi:transcriptional regulator with XRE-family HTH domain